MAKAALFAALLALGLSGWLVWKTSCSSCGATSAPEPAPTGDVARLEAIERRLAAIEEAPRPATVANGPTLGTTSGAGPSYVPGAQIEREKAAAARLDDFEKRLASVEESRKKEGEPAWASALPGGARARLAGRPPGWVMSTEDAQKELELTDGQKAEWDRIVADSRRETEALRKIPDDEGKTWDQVQKEMVADLMGSSAGGSKLDLSKVMAFRNKNVPGRSETYGQADQRIKDDAKKRLRDTLTTAQADKFDKTNVDSMLGGGGLATAITFPVGVGR